MSLPELRKIAENASKDAFTIERIHWHKGVNANLLYFPEVLTPLYHCQSYKSLLDEDDRKYYNHLYAQYVSEQFIFLEDRFLCRVVEGLLPWSLSISWDLKRCLEIFLAEEVKHTEMFRRLNKICNPDRYSQNDFHFLELKNYEERLISLMAKFPRHINYWIWVALLFEEKTIDYFSHYRMQNRDQKSAQLDPLHYQVHQFHMLDEARHVQIDEHLLNLIFNQAGQIMRRINIYLLRKTMVNYTNPRRANIRIIEELCRTRHRLKSQTTRICDEIRAQNGQSPYQLAQFSRRNFPKTFSYFDSDADIQREMMKVILTYHPQTEQISA